jgi:diadenosine tetraphosphatase ApaH/serine/threonine PP2A family protein phosphatase
MTVAAIYDVHGNLPALDAVLAEVEADTIVFGGDLVWGPWPAETLRRARALGDRALFLRGNWERGVVERVDESAAWVADRLTAEERELLASWPLTLTVHVDGLGETLFCHATPRSDEELVSHASSEARWRDVLADVTQRTVICGHTHIQFDHVAAGVRVVNPGSVGNPTGAAAAYWASLGPDVALRRTAYDAAATSAAMRETGFPLSAFADELLQPWPVERVLRLVAESGG